MTYFTVAVISALCLLLPVTRVYGIVGAGILTYFFPVPTLGILLLGGAAYYYFRK
ncbi:MAG: hypothetical protein ACYTF1_23805 [Planctomycetota bacterium]|jgi:hypothetical protein